MRTRGIALASIITCVGFTGSTAAVLQTPVIAATTAGTIQTYAGGGVGDHGPATAADVANPQGLAVDTAGNLYIANMQWYVGPGDVRRISSSGQITSVTDAGGKDPGFVSPDAVAADAAGDLYVADGGGGYAQTSVVWRVDAHTGAVTRFAGIGGAVNETAFEANSATEDFIGLGLALGDNGPATNASLMTPSGLAVDSHGNVYIADSQANRIRMVDAQGIITTVAGGVAPSRAGVQCSSYNEGGAATQACLSQPQQLAIDASDNLYIADMMNNEVRVLDHRTGTLHTIAGTGVASFSGDGGKATAATLRWPQGVAVSSSGVVDVADTSNNRIRRIDPASHIITTIAGATPLTPDSGLVYPGGGIASAEAVGDGDRAIGARLLDPAAVAFRGETPIISDSGHARVRSISRDGNIHTIAGMGFAPGLIAAFAGDGGSRLDAKLVSPHGIARDPAGSIVIADTAHNRVRRVDRSGVISTIAGTGVAGFVGDGGAATQALLNQPTALAFDGSGDLYIADTGNSCIRRVDRSGVITTVAGTLRSDFTGDGGPAARASLNAPQALAVDRTGNVYIADTLNNRVRRINAATHVITTVAGSGGTDAQQVGDGGPATAATLDTPLGLVVDGSGNLYISDSHHNRVRMVNGGGLITTVAGTGAPTPVPGSLNVAEPSAPVDGISATQSTLNQPDGLAFAGTDLLIADSGDGLVRRVDSGGTISTVAGEGTAQSTASSQTAPGIGDGGPATSAVLDHPSGLMTDADGIFITDTGHGRVRQVQSGGASTGGSTSRSGTSASVSEAAAGRHQRTRWHPW